MPYRNTPFVNNEYYHIYNRGSEKRIIFNNKREYKRFLKTLQYYQLSGPKPKLSNFFKYKNFDPLKASIIVDILAFCLMPNHFHLLVKQNTEMGITELMTKLSLSYTKYFNIKYKRVGPLFQGEFKAVLIESDEQLIHVSRYIHLNPLVSLLVKDLLRYEYSSYREYLSLASDKICVTGEVLKQVGSLEKYKKFVLDQSDYGMTLEKIRHQVIEEM